jgi:hypothetical protein
MTIPLRALAVAAAALPAAPQESADAAEDAYGTARRLTAPRVRRGGQP